MKLRVATINLMAPAGPFFPWGDRADRLAALLVAPKPDLIGTQEATGESLHSLSRVFPDYGVFGRGRWADGTGIQCAVLYRRERFELLDGGHFWMSHKPDRPGSKLLGMGSARVATWAVLQGEECTFTWLNLHFSHLCRRSQARLALSQLSSRPRPWLVTGDFNSTPWPPWSAHRIFTTELQDLAESSGATWSGGTGLPVARLDWILGTSEWRACSSCVVRQGDSDHWPVFADLELQLAEAAL